MSSFCVDRVGGGQVNKIDLLQITNQQFCQSTSDLQLVDLVGRGGGREGSD